MLLAALNRMQDHRPAALQPPYPTPAPGRPCPRPSTPFHHPLLPLCWMQVWCCPHHSVLLAGIHCPQDHRPATHPGSLHPSPPLPPPAPHTAPRFGAALTIWCCWPFNPFLPLHPIIPSTPHPTPRFGAALIIQCCWHGHIARKTTALLRTQASLPLQPPAPPPAPHPPPPLFLYPDSVLPSSSNAAGGDTSPARPPPCYAPRQPSSGVRRVCRLCAGTWLQLGFRRPGANTGRG